MRHSCFFLFVIRIHYIIILSLLLCLYRHRSVSFALPHCTSRQHFVAKPCSIASKRFSSIQCSSPLFFLLLCDNISVDKYTREHLDHHKAYSYSNGVTAHSHLPQWIGLHFLFALQWKWIEFSILAKSSYLKLKSYTVRREEVKKKHTQAKRNHIKIRKRQRGWENMLTFERYLCCMKHSIILPTYSCFVDVIVWAYWMLLI